jgi:hypothetical protein
MTPSLSYGGILRRSVVKHNQFNCPRPCFRRSSVSRERPRHPAGGNLASLVSSISVTDGVRQRHAVEPTRRGYLATLSGRVPLEQGAFLPSDAEYGYEACFATPSRQVPKPACFAAGCRRAPWQGAFYDAVQQSMVFYDISQYTTAHMFTIWNCNLVVPLESSAYLLVPGGSNYGAVVGWGGKRVRPKLEAERSKDGSLYDSWA